MATIDESLAWAGIPVPESLKNLEAEKQAALADYAKALVAAKTDGLDELYQAIGMIVKYIPHFIVIPLMVEHIRPQIAAGVCLKMGVEQAVHYANDLPIEYFSEVSKHIGNEMMGSILEKMKRHHAEKVIKYELHHNQTHMLDIAAHLDKRMLEYVARQVTLPDLSDALTEHPQSIIIEQLRALQKA
jgi:hypothetical protein